MSNNNELIYQKANVYRLHADNLRWSLLGGFVAILVAIFSIPQSNSFKFDNPTLSLLFFLISFAYLWILAIQNWFYNLFAQFVNDCEARLIKNKDLISLNCFAVEIGGDINPFHPSFFLAEIIVASIAYYFLCSFFDNIRFDPVTDTIYRFGENTPFIIKIIGYFIYMSVLHIIFKNWNRFIYKPIIKKVSNLYRQKDIPTQKNPEA